METSDIQETIEKMIFEFPICRVSSLGMMPYPDSNDRPHICLLVEFSSRPITLLTLSAFDDRFEELSGVPCHIYEVPLPPTSTMNVSEAVVVFEQSPI